MLAACGIGLFLARRLLPEKRQQGVMTQAVFRSNFVLIGLYIAGTLVPNESTASVAVLSAVTAIPQHLTRTSSQPRKAAPLLGEDNEAIYGQMLGLDAEKLAALKEKGVI